MNRKFENRRKYHRIDFDGKVCLEFYRQNYENLQVKDLSLTGIFVMGDFSQQQLQNCHVRIYHKETSGNNSVRALGEVVWGNDKGVGLRFTRMSLADFILLQRTLVDQAEQPEVILREFSQDLPFEIEN